MTRSARLLTLTAVLIAATACGADVTTDSTDTTETAFPTVPSTTVPPTTTERSEPDRSEPGSLPSVATAPVATQDVETTTPAPDGHTVIDARGVAVDIDAVDRIIPLDGDVAEVVFALGMGDRVVATDLSATYPPEADALPQIGYQRALTAEPILEFEPTLLIATDIAGPPETLDALERVGVPLVIVPTDVAASGPARKITAVAAALGVPERGRDLAQQVQREIDDAIATRDDAESRPRVAALYVRGTSAQLVLGEAFAIHWLIEAAGGDDIADELGITESASITDEAMLAAAPDVLLVPASGLESVGGIDGLLAAVPALSRTPAGQAGAVLSYDDQLMLGNGPRTGSFLATLIADLREFAPNEP